MSEGSDKINQIPVSDAIDFTKNITGLTIQGSYVYALEQLMMYFIMQLENPIESKAMFQKFEKYVSNELDIKKEPFTELELHLYTIFSLQQLLRAKAHEQGLIIKVDATIDQPLIEELLKATFDGDFDKVKEINKKMAEQISSQSS